MRPLAAILFASFVSTRLIAGEFANDATSRQAKAPADGEVRRRHVAAALERVMGPLPNPAQRVALDLKVLEEVTLEAGLVRRKLSYQTDATDRVAAYLFLPGQRQ